MILSKVTDLIGNTPILGIPIPSKKTRLLLKIEKNNPGGSIKDRMARNMIVAAMITFAFSLVVWLLPSAGQMFGGTAGDVMTYLSVMNHQENLGRGIIDTIDLLYYGSFILAALFLTIRSVETYHWR